MPERLHTPLPLTHDAAAKARHYQAVVADIKAVLQDEPNWVAAMATVSGILHQAFEYNSWTGFYCAWPHEPQGELVVGPYQGSLGCLRIPFARGVCGAAARTRQTQLVPDVHAFPGHIACASSTQSEVVVPVLAQLEAGGPTALLAVLDVDSDHSAAFDAVDVEHLEGLCSWLGSTYSRAALHGGAGQTR